MKRYLFYISMAGILLLFVLIPLARTPQIERDSTLVESDNPVLANSIIASGTQFQIDPVWAQKTVEAFEALKPGDIPDGLLEGVLPDIKFDVNRYFTVLTHLSMEPGYVLDWIYPGDKMFGGRPIIYVRKVAVAPFKTYSEFETATAGLKPIDNTFDFVSLFMDGNGAYFDNKILIDNTPEGFFEYVILNMLGGQFYLFQHANYNDNAIFCSNAAIEQMLKRGQPFRSDRPYPDDLLLKSRCLKPAPIVLFNDNTVSVRVTYFTNWGGFIRTSTVISRGRPYSCVKIYTHVLIHYQCGVTF
jgi:hypothetical protein